MNNTIIFLSLFILFLSLMLEFKVKIILDVNSNILNIYVYLFRLRIVYIEISLVGLYYKINNSKKIKKLKLVLTKEETYLIKQIKKSILDKLYYDDIVLQSKIGVGDADKTAIDIGLLNLICIFGGDYLQSKNRDTVLYYNNLPDFEQMNLYVDLEVKFYFTIFDLVFAIIMSFYKRGKYVKERKQKG